MFVDDKRQGETAPLVVDRVGQILLDAAAYIEKHGWCQNNFQMPDGRVCASGAIGCAMGVTDSPLHYHQARSRLCCHLREVKQVSMAGIEVWNDFFGQTKENVVANIRAAALRED